MTGEIIRSDKLELQYNEVFGGLDVSDATRKEYRTRNMTKQPRNIYCLEGNWSTNPRCRQSVRPMLDILRDAAGIKYIYRKCNTREEFFEYLRQYTFKRYRNNTVLYIAFHGRPNKIKVGRDFVTLREIADVLEGHLTHRIAYFGSCSTMRTKRANIDDFPHRTKADILAGYRKDVDLILATAWELCCFFDSKIIFQLTDQIKRLPSFVLYEFSKL